MAKNDIRVRSLSRLYIAAISRIHSDACQIAYRFMGWNYNILDVESLYARKFAEWDWGCMAAKGGTSVGLIAMSSGLIDQLFVHPDTQRQGVGSALLERAIGRGIRPVTLHVFKENTSARLFYEQFGLRKRTAGSMSRAKQKSFFINSHRHCRGGP